MGRLFLVNARVLTPEPSEAGGIELADGKIVGFTVGRKTTGRRPGDEVVDLCGMTVLPAFADAHVHVRNWAIGSLALDLTGTRDLAEALRKLGEASAKLAPGEWLRGRNWNRNAWADPSWPSRDDLDGVDSGRPILVESLDLHGCWVNSAALETAGLAGRFDEPPDEGIMVRPAGDGKVEGTGILREDAAWALVNRVPEPGEAAVDSGIRAVCSRLSSLGVTAVTDFDGLAAARQYGRLDPELHILASCRPPELDDLESSGLTAGSALGPRVRLGPLKLFLDGSLGSKTAWMLDGYETDPSDRGMSTLPEGPLRELAARAMANGLQLALHAIGDRANRAALDLFAELRPRHPDAVLRVEHAQLLAASDVGRFAALSAVASMQPSHLTDDVPSADREWGKRSRLAYAFASLRESGATLAFGSDVPVGDPDPRNGLDAAVLRRDRAGRPPGGWYPAEALDRSAALAAYTRGAQRLCGRSGAVAAGEPADLVLVCGDPLAGGRFEIRGTWVAGRRVFG